MDKVQEAIKRLLEHNAAECTKTAPIISIEGWGKSSKLFICGIDVSRGIKSAVYSADPRKNNHLVLDIDIDEMIGLLADVPAGEMRKAREIILPYIKDRL